MRKDTRGVCGAWKALSARAGRLDVASGGRGVGGGGRRLVESGICICKLFFIHQSNRRARVFSANTRATKAESAELRLWINFLFPFFFTRRASPRSLIGSRQNEKLAEGKKSRVCTCVYVQFDGSEAESIVLRGTFRIVASVCCSI